MNLKTNHKAFIFCLIISLLVNNVGCLKRVSVPNTSEQIDGLDFVYVILTSGVEYKVKNPMFHDHYLIGYIDRKEIKIPASDIKTIEIVKQDKKKIIRGTVIGVVVILTLGLVLSTKSPIHIGSVD